MFLALSVGLRVIVYEFHLGNYGKSMNLFLSDLLDQETMKELRPKGLLPAVGVNLLRTCKQIHQEAGNVVYKWSTTI